MVIFYEDYDLQVRTSFIFSGRGEMKASPSMGIPHYYAVVVDRLVRQR